MKYNREVDSEKKNMSPRNDLLRNRRCVGIIQAADAHTRTFRLRCNDDGAVGDASSLFKNQQQQQQQQHQHTSRIKQRLLVSPPPVSSFRRKDYNSLRPQRHQEVEP
ncbi:hypothetical protein F2P81_011496 [Scophthalmus maximus]|uniref:Uncharacterized protein n=1 Tax=Scophthalmus maximus TaxID=52904 RepID=A0A6A4SYR2_SCOMX|nr:hypothetical protein F2P81_011496 [Scophthalmus maximus]